MGVVVGDRSEGDKEDAILITEKEFEQKRGRFSIYNGVPLIFIGALIFFISVSNAHRSAFFFLIFYIYFYFKVLVWCIAYIPWYDRAAPVFWIILGIFIFIHGVIAYFNPPKIYSLDVIINGRHSTSNLHLRTILVCATNIICGIIGIITMVRNIIK